MFELLNNSGTGLQTHKRCYCMCLMKLQICVQFFLMHFLERSSKDCGYHNSDFVSCKAESHYDSHVLCNKSYLCSNI